MSVKWCAPVNEVLTINCGGFYSELSNQGGTRLILRNFASTTKGAKCAFTSEALSPEYVEGLTFLVAVKWAQNRRLDALNFETYFKSI